MLKELVRERLMAAADEIFALFERTIASYEEELSRTRKKERQLEAASRSPIVLHVEDVQQLIGRQEERPPQLHMGSSALNQEDPQPPRIKEEEAELGITQDIERLPGPKNADATELPLPVVSVKIKDGEDEPQADNLIAPLSDSDDMSHFPENEDRNDAQRPSSSDANCEGDIGTRTGNDEPECSNKKTVAECFTCSVCAKSYSKAGSLTRHMWTHTGGNPVCGEQFAGNVPLDAHVETHVGEKHFSCSICGDRFVQSSSLKAHLRTHAGLKPFGCSICGDTFSQKSSLKGHIRTHTGEKPFSCIYCGKRFSCRGNMNVHMRTHTGEKPFGCLICGKIYSHKKNLKAHMLRHN
ncbi:uncharacterized protein [Nerophis lumbriciformis]|uniref:uncharacterized protein n=1 Tax=Nerophis lumbriciformis TaxID=546530 RepID=UPI002ADF0EA4|nr:oocyte zinc finger protein XlCOF8.4-like [Nerophis lumbriciformis]